MRANLRALVLTAALLQGGCTLGPDFTRPLHRQRRHLQRSHCPPKPNSAPVVGGEAQRFISGADIPGEWWTLFHSEALNSLVRDALRANPTLPAAQAALRNAMENLQAQVALVYPQVSANLAPSGNRQSARLSPLLSSNALLYGLYQAQLNASWTPDIFGNNRRQVEALRAQAEVQRYQLDAAYLSLTANVIAAAVQEASLRGQIDAVNQVIQSISDALVIMRRQMELGQIAGAEVAAQEAALAQARKLCRHCKNSSRRNAIC